MSRGKTDFSRCMVIMLYAYEFWVLRFSDDITRFEVNSPILWLVTMHIRIVKSLDRDFLKTKHSIRKFYGIRLHTDFRGWELNTEYAHVWPFFVHVLRKKMTILVKVIVPIKGRPHYTSISSTSGPVVVRTIVTTYQSLPYFLVRPPSPSPQSGVKT